MGLTHILERVTSSLSKRNISVFGVSVPNVFVMEIVSWPRLASPSQNAIKVPESALTKTWLGQYNSNQRLFQLYYHFSCKQCYSCIHNHMDGNVSLTEYLPGKSFFQTKVQHKTHLHMCRWENWLLFKVCSSYISGCYLANVQCHCQPMMKSDVFK